MIFDDILADIRRLVGIRLKSIHRGSEITLVEVDSASSRVVLETIAGDTRTRSFSELKRIWEGLCSKPAVHVDSLLGGSGSSRNQPETLLANLPYIEWLSFERKKHLSYVGAPTHEIGTLREMDPVRAEGVRSALRNLGEPAEVISNVIVSGDIRATARAMEALAGTSVVSVEPGVYCQPKARTLMVSRDLMADGIAEGPYALVTSRAEFPVRSRFRVAGKEILVPLEEKGVLVIRTDLKVPRQ